MRVREASNIRFSWSYHENDSKPIQERQTIGTNKSGHGNRHQSLLGLVPVDPPLKRLTITATIRGSAERRRLITVSKLETPVISLDGLVTTLILAIRSPKLKIQWMKGGTAHPPQIQLEVNPT